MGFAEVLTLIFIVLKLIGIISWGWFYVLLPEIIAGGIYIILLIIYIISIIKFRKEQRKWMM